MSAAAVAVADVSRSVRIVIYRAPEGGFDRSRDTLPDEKVSRQAAK